jgi:hypothetical protein
MFKRGLLLSSPWRDFQRREWIVFLLWLGYIPGVFALGYRCIGCSARTCHS